MPGWIRRGWKTAGGEPVKNRDLWERLHAAASAAHGSTGAGSRVTPGIPRTSASTSWRASQALKHKELTHAR